MTREQRVATLAALWPPWAGDRMATARSAIDAMRHVPRRLSLTQPAGFRGRNACQHGRGPDACEKGDGGRTRHRILDLSRVKEEPRLQGGHSRPYVESKKTLQCKDSLQYLTSIDHNVAIGQNLYPRCAPRLILPWGTDRGTESRERSHVSPRQGKRFQIRIAAAIRQAHRRRR